MMNKIQKNGEIEFLRFVFACIIVIHHSSNFLFGGNWIFQWGSFSVEFYFIVSGYLMMNSIEKRREPSPALGKETVQFLRGKLKALCPEIIVA